MITGIILLALLVLAAIVCIILGIVGFTGFALFGDVIIFILLVVGIAKLFKRKR